MSKVVFEKRSFLLFFYLLVTEDFAVGGKDISCKPVSVDPNSCGELHKVEQCLLYPSASVNCGKRQCSVSRKICYPIGTKCKPKCCFNWDKDSKGKCTVFIGTLAPDTSITTGETTILSAVVVAVVFVVMLTFLAFFRLCHLHRTQHNRTINNQTPQQSSNDNILFQMYNNDPPPYEIAISGSLPEYRPMDKPPKYIDIEAGLPNE